MHLLQLSCTVYKIKWIGNEVIYVLLTHGTRELLAWTPVHRVPRNFCGIKFLLCREHDYISTNQVFHGFRSLVFLSG